jgi:hypothetical protein
LGTKKILHLQLLLRICTIMIIANPIYDLAFKRLMENKRVAKFFHRNVSEGNGSDGSPRSAGVYPLR